MNGIEFPVARVLDGIDAAIEAGLAPVKVNMVVRRGVNEASVLPMATWARERGAILRFIEYMDVGHSNGWRLDEVVPAADLIDAIAAVWPIEPAEPAYRGEVAGRWRYADGGGEFGVITSVTQPFCRDCTRARLSAEGKLYTCLFAVDGHDLKGMLRSGASDAELTDAVEAIWLRRGDRYSELRSAATSTLPKIEMFAMGG
jgi:cyclic pyranopterin phosphate synthase